MKPEGFPRRLRLRRRREFLRVQRGGHKHHTRFFLVFVAPTPRPRSHPQGSGASRADSRSAEASRRSAEPDPRLADGDLRLASADLRLPGTRLGVTVTRKVGKAVMRNRIKRLVREAFRRERRALPDGLDMVWVAKRDASALTFEAAVHDMRALAGRLARGSRSR